MFNHIEYDSDSLSEEYVRDRENGDQAVPPHGYFPMNDPSLKPENRWRSHAHLLFANWINAIYQKAPFDIARIGETASAAQR
jgi:homoserine O-succinyltransferase